MEPTIYQKIGGETILKKLVKTFYQNMDNLEEAKGIRSLHAKNLRVSEEKLYMFLSGFFGGPSLYIEKYGHPKLRQRHLPFKIGESEAKQWIFCMEKSLEEVIDDKEVRQAMLQYFIQTAHHMRNVSEGLESNLLNSRIA